MDQIIGGNGRTRFIQSAGVNDVLNSPGDGSPDGRLRVGVEGDDLALYELHGGELLTDLTDIGAWRGHGLFRQTGGLHHVLKTARIAYAEESEGSYELQGGSLVVDGGLDVGFRGPGEFAVIGSDATLQLGALNVGDTGTLSFTVSASGVSAADVAGNAYFTGALEVLNDGAGPGRFPLLNVGGNLDFDPLSLSLPGANWSWGIEGGTSLWVEHVPEPAALSLLALGGLAVVRRKRRR